MSADRRAQPGWVDGRLQRSDRPWNKVHLDFHNTPHVGSVGHDFDPGEFVATLKQGRVEAIVVFAKDMHGWFYYPAARAAAVHPGLHRDLMGEQVAACRLAGIKVYAYYCLTWDHLLADQHPDWLVVRRDRRTYLPTFDQTPGWTALCLRNPDFLALSLADSTDLLSRYELDGIWYDMPFPIGGECYCHLCLAALRDAGLDPLDPVVQRADKQALWVDWQRRSHTVAQRLRPGCDDNRTRIRSEAAFAKMCGACPIPAGSGKTNGRHRLNRGGNRQANAALYRVVIVRMRWHQPTIDYVTRRATEGLSKREIIRCLKRFLAREIYHLLPPIETATAPPIDQLDQAA